MMIRRVTRNMAALSIAAILLFAHTPGTAFARDNAKFTAQLDAASTASNPITISSAEELYEFAQFVNGYGAAAESAGSKTLYPHGYYKLTRDIDLSAYGAGWNDGQGWTPIGDNYLRFEGSFDGGGHVITGLYINRPDVQGPQGLFGIITRGVVKNLGLVDVNITGYLGVGGIAARANNGSIERCFVTGSVFGNNEVGGIVGDATRCILSNCYTTCDVTGVDTYVPGYCVGGVAGRIDIASGIENCYATGNVTGHDQVGGIIGAFYSDDCLIKNCAALNASVNGTSFIGRVVGFTSYDIIKTAGNVFFAGLMFHGNYALKDMKIADMDKNDKKNGADMSRGKAATKSFWTDRLLFDESVWILEDGKLPMLRGISGQVGRPLEQ